jgi:Tfp pilus assembly protein PilN
VGPVKKEIDLRPREFIQALGKHKRRLALGILAVSATGAVLLCLILAEQSTSRLSEEIALLRQTNQDLAARAAPLAQLEAEIRMLEEKEALKDSLQEQLQPWSAYLRQIEAALPEHLRLKALAADSRGQLTLDGYGPAMPQVASYSQALQTLEFINHSTVSRIELDAAGGYRFMIQATFEK